MLRGGRAGGRAGGRETVRGGGTLCYRPCAEEDVVVPEVGEWQQDAVHEEEAFHLPLNGTSFYSRHAAVRGVSTLPEILVLADVRFRRRAIES